MLPTKFASTGGFVLRGKSRKFAYLGEAAALTPPTVAPVLSVSAELGSYVANLVWTASNKTGSTGFGYEVWGKLEVDNYALLSTTTDTFYDFDAVNVGGTYLFYIVPINSAGEGPSSNTASVVLPGESEPAAYYRRPDASSRYLRPDGISFYLRP